MKAWEEFLTLQEKELGAETVRKWLHPLKILRYDACNLYLEAKDSFQAIWFEEHIRPRVQTKFINPNSKRIKVHLSIAKLPAKEKNPALPGKFSKKIDPSAPTIALFKIEWDRIDPSATFQSFVCSEGHFVTYKLLCELTGYDPQEKAFNPSQIKLSSFNPIYLHGESGSGKTHLLMAIANHLQSKGLKVVYTRADTFTEHVVSAIRAGEMQAFRKAYRNIDVLLVDDIEVFSRKGATQEEFFHTFNTLHVEGKQIILSANCTPQELKLIEPRLVSRFEWGIVLPLEHLKKAEMRQVLINRAQALNFTLQEKVIEFFLATFARNNKTLIKALEGLVLRTHLNQAEGRSFSLPLSLEDTQELLEDLIKSEQQAVLTPNKIIQTVAEFYGIKVDDILGKAQSRDCALPRQIAMHICRNHLQMPYMKIGDLFSRDHSTVMASVKQIQKSMNVNHSEISGIITGILKQLKAGL